MKLWEPLYKIEEAEWIVLGIPFAGKVTSSKGCEKAPDSIRKHFQNYWTYDLKNKRDLFEERIVDIGNTKSKTYNSLEKELSKTITGIKKKNPKAKMLFLGGDHSITPILTKSLNISSYLCLDAHFDLIDKYENQDKNSHACANRRVYEQNVKMHLRGVRSSSKEEHEFAEKKKINWQPNFSYNSRVDYFSFDADVMDPAYTNTGTPEMFGCTPEQAVNTIRNSYFKYFDLVEWIPDKGYPYIIQIIKEVLLK